MNRKPTPAEKKEYESFARAAFGIKKPEPKTATDKAAATQKASVKRIFAQETKP